MRLLMLWERGREGGGLEARRAGSQQKRMSWWSGGPGLRLELALGYVARATGPLRV